MLSMIRHKKGDVPEIPKMYFHVHTRLLLSNRIKTCYIRSVNVKFPSFELRRTGLKTYWYMFIDVIIYRNMKDKYLLRL